MAKNKKQKKYTTKKSKTVVFHRNICFGKNAAEHDSLLESCFVDTGFIDLLKSHNSHGSILLGRTGSGKTALLKKLIEQTDNCIRINPEELSLSYLSNSTIIPKLENLGVHLELFYKLLWRHVFSTEILKKKFNISGKKTLEHIFDRIKKLIGVDKNKTKALEYLSHWGDQFWESLQDRTREITQQLESKIDSSIGCAKIAKLCSGVSSSEIEKETIVDKCHKVVSSIQIRELTGIIQVLEDITKDDKYSPFYIVIDDLDKDWADSTTRMKLIRALINEIMEFTKVKNCKIIISMRYDLLMQVFQNTRDPGYQEEKYKDLFIKIAWNEKELTDLIERRINQVFKSLYTSEKIGLNEIFPSTINGMKPINYILKRTFMRPRDIIDFFNSIAESAAGSTGITAKAIASAEALYSKERFEALCTEWHSIYPNLFNAAICFLKGRNKEIPINDIDEYHLLEFKEKYCQQNHSSADEISEIVQQLDEDNLSKEYELLWELLKIFFRTGIIGIKENSNNEIIWSTAVRACPVFEIEDKIVIHPALYKVLAIKGI